MLFTTPPESYKKKLKLNVYKPISLTPIVRTIKKLKDENTM